MSKFISVNVEKDSSSTIGSLAGIDLTTELRIEVSDKSKRDLCVY